jgi:hypothetical protein
MFLQIHSRTLNLSSHTARCPLSTVRCQLNAVIFLIFFLFTFSSTRSQTLEGSTGLFFIPTAEMQKDGQLNIGINYLDKSLIAFSGYQRSAFTPYFSITFLPFFELSGKITRLINSNNSNEGIGDRTISMRFRLFKETDNYPSLVVGLHDIAGVYGGNQAILNNALYVVCSKKMEFESILIDRVSIHTGYGLDVLEAQHHNFVGLFGGIDLEFFNMIELMTEYDGTHSNGGMRLKLLDHVSLLGGFLRYKYFSGGATINFQL